MLFIASEDRIVVGCGHFLVSDVPVRTSAELRNDCVELIMQNRTTKE